MLFQESTKSFYPVFDAQFSQSEPQRGLIAGDHGFSCLLFESLKDFNGAEVRAADKYRLVVLTVHLLCHRVSILRGQSSDHVVLELMGRKGFVEALDIRHMDSATFKAFLFTPVDFGCIGRGDGHSFNLENIKSRILNFCQSIFALAS